MRFSPSVRAMLLRMAFYGALAVLVTWPLVFHLSDRLLGDRDVDVWNHVWGFWWVKMMLLEHHQLPLFTELLAWPRGGRLYFIDPLNALLSLPLQVLFGLVPAFNLTVMGELALAGLGAHLLAREAGASERGALLAGVLLTLSPVLRCEVHNGITEVCNVGWLALSLAATHRAVRTAAIRAALLAGLLMGLAFVACWYYGLAAGICGGLIWLMRTPWRPLELPRGRAHLGRLVAAGTTWALVAVPFALAFSWTLQGPDAIIHRPPSIGSFLIRHNATDLLGFFMPGDYHRPDLLKDYGEHFLHTTYLGYVALALGALGLWMRPVRGWMWALTGLVFTLLALGPYLYIGGEFATYHGQRLRLPFKMIFEGMGLMAITHPGRMVMVTLLCLGVLVAAGHDRLAASFQRIRGVFMPAGVAALVVESLIFAPGPFPLPTSSAVPGECTTLLADDPVAGAVLDLPGYYRATMRSSRYLFDQTRHGRPIPYLVDVRAEVAPALGGEGLYRYILDVSKRDEMRPGDRHPQALENIRNAPPETLRSQFMSQFGSQHYRYVVIHRDMAAVPFGAWPYRRIFDQVLGPPRSTSDGCWIYTVDPVSPAPSRPMP